MQGVQETDFAKRWFVGPWLALLGLKLWLASRLPLFVDEAFYWQEGRHLAWAYSDLPGLTAWLARIGDGLGDGTLALRLPFLAIAAAIPWLVVRLAARELDPKAGWHRRRTVRARARHPGLAVAPGRDHGPAGRARRAAVAGHAAVPGCRRAPVAARGRIRGT